MAHCKAMPIKKPQAGSVAQPTPKNKESVRV